ncbi:MAG: TonB-dependent receptor [Saprospiraceae bacterium]|nr:TonB-dependent receptor [Saprospiraceae bacterium]
MRYFYIVLISYIGTFVSAQNITGMLKDKTGSPIEYANIIIPKYNLHTHSDDRGKYDISGIKAGDTILVSHMTFQSVILIPTAKDFESTVVTVLLEKNIDLDQVTISPHSQALKTLSRIDIQTNPVNNAQELLRHVPGLVIGQHAGGGKAEQIFLRGFDIDHGTDINISFDGLPVNMVSHAHGQGYADMHFIMPEIIEDITYGKGPYDADKGNLATAGYVAFKTKDSPQNSFFSTEFGSFNTRRTAGLVNLLASQNESAYIASEYLLSDGPFESSQAFNRFNLFAKYTKRLENNDKISIWASRFTSRWNASGQIPDRAVANGLIGRFGAIDDTEGGNTSRSNVVLNYTKYLADNQFVKTRAFVSAYDFLLYSNFTFFLNDSINGDQIRQKENRQIYGLDTELNYRINKNSDSDLLFKIGTGIRYDDVNDIELSNTLNRKTTLSHLALGQVDESNIFGHADATFVSGKWMLNAGIRADYFKFIYENQLSALYDLRYATKTAWSPKLNIQYTINKSIQLFAKSGKGFHSNDTRVVIDEQAQHVLPAAYGIDFGGVLKPNKNLIINAALWYLHLDQEFVYVGDGGIVEPSGRSRRQGLDFGVRYQPTHWMFIYSDLNLANPRSVDDAEGENYIPLAPTLTNTGGISFHSGQNISGGLRYRHVADRPANEDNSIVAQGYTVIDLNVNYTFKNIMLGLEINNLFNTEWNETQFATESRLKDEAAPVEEIHFTPGIPFFIKGKLTYLF